MPNRAGRRWPSSATGVASNSDGVQASALKHQKALANDPLGPSDSKIRFGGRDRAGAGAQQEANLEAASQEPLGDALRFRHLRR